MMQIDLDLEAADNHLNHCHREIEEVWKDIDLLCMPFVDVLSQVEYLEEMNVEREG